jgi:hypothetical protein
MKRRRLKIKDGLRWRGHIDVIGWVERGEDGQRWHVAFDAFDDKSTSEHYIADHTTLTTGLIEEWTGVRLAEPKTLPGAGDSE